MIMASIYLFQRQHEKAIAEGQRAIALNPNYADGYAMLSQIMRYSGRFEEALALIEKGNRLCPIPTFFYTVNLAHVYLMLERYDKALSVSKQLLDRCKRGHCPPWIGHRTLALAYVGLSRVEEARAEVKKLLRINPTNSQENFRKLNPYKDPSHMEKILSAGMNAYVSKPIDKEQLFRTIERTINPLNPEQESVRIDPGYLAQIQIEKELAGRVDFSGFIEDYRTDLKVARQLLTLFVRDVPGRIALIEENLEKVNQSVP